MKIIRVLILVITVFSLFFSCTFPWVKKEIIDRKIYGVIIQKYIDHSDHGAAFIEYNMGDNDLKLWVDAWPGAMWNDMKIGDSVIKKSGSTKIRIKKPDGKFHDYEMEP